jgi:hypothetical protein
MSENRGKVKIIPSQTIFDTSNTDIRDQPDWLHIARWVWKSKKNESFPEIQDGAPDPKNLTERFRETKCLETSLSIL